MDSTCQCRRPRFHPWVGKTPWTRDWQPTLVFLPGKYHGQKSLVVYTHMGLQKETAKLSSKVAVPYHFTFPWVISESSCCSTSLPAFGVSVFLNLADARNQLIGKDPGGGKDWHQEEKGETGNEMVGWHYWLNGHKFEQTQGDSEGQGRVVNLAAEQQSVSIDISLLFWFSFSWWFIMWDIFSYAPLSS